MVIRLCGECREWKRDVMLDHEPDWSEAPHFFGVCTRCNEVTDRIGDCLYGEIAGSAPKGAQAPEGEQEAPKRRKHRRETKPPDGDTKNGESYVRRTRDAMVLQQVGMFYGLPRTLAAAYMDIAGRHRDAPGRPTWSSQADLDRVDDWAVRHTEEEILEAAMRSRSARRRVARQEAAEQKNREAHSSGPEEPVSRALPGKGGKRERDGSHPSPADEARMQGVHGGVSALLKAIASEL